MRLPDLWSANSRLSLNPSLKLGIGLAPLGQFSLFEVLLPGRETILMEILLLAENGRSR
jgi:hypothetical protein